MRTYIRVPIAVVLATLALLPPVACTTDPERPTRDSVRPSGEMWYRAACGVSPRYLELMDRGIYPGREPDLLVLPKYPHLVGSTLVSQHSGPWPFLQDVPLIFYGPRFIRSRGRVTLDREVTVADAAPTTGKLIRANRAPFYQGRVLNEILVPENEHSEVPKLVVTIVWDGGGDNVLSRYPDAWPTLADLADRGASVDGAIVGSSPSVTPAIHSTLGTGVFPEKHGVLNIAQRQGKSLQDPFANNQARALAVRTLADRYDLKEGNLPLIGMLATKGWHLGMVGHGAALKGADKDFVVLADDSTHRLVANERFYTLPHYLNAVTDFEDLVAEADISDGARDGSWSGHSLDLEDSRGLFMTPTWVAHETRLLQTLIRKEGFGQDPVPDLIYINYKAIDYFQHRYTMFHPDMEAVIRGVDDSLNELISFLDESIGRGNWVAAVTADHGVGLPPEKVGGWPINVEVVEDDLAQQFGKEAVQAVRPTGIYMDLRSLREDPTLAAQVANFLLRYTIKDAAQGRLPQDYADRTDERLFAAVFPSASSDEVLACATARRRRS